jgi:AraC family transcriptional regulator of adaptative response/methylated-DNA-[protein]-cysteine methyltransferase
MLDLHEEALWNAVSGRDALYSGVFYFGVKTTGVYCRPGCPSPMPRRENVVFAFSPARLVAAGYRPCRRCRPEQSGKPEASIAAVVDLCRKVRPRCPGLLLVPA